MASLLNYYWPTTLTITLADRRRARRAAGAWAHCPVEVVDGDAAPQIVGRGYYWTTLSGRTEVHHPSSYGWPTWYHASALRVQVSRDWLCGVAARAA